MPTDTNLVTDAAMSILENMHTVQHLINSAEESAVRPSLQATWNSLETMVLDLLPGCALPWMAKKEATFSANSAEVIKRLPVATAYNFSAKATLAMNDAMHTEVYALAVERKFLRPTCAERLLEHRPHDEAWTDYLVDVLSPTSIFEARGCLMLWDEHGLQNVTDSARAVRVLKAQVEHHPNTMDICLAQQFNYNPANPDVPLALYLAGARLSGRLSEAMRGPSQLPEQLESAHGRLELVAAYGDLDAIIARFCAASQNTPR